MKLSCKLISMLLIAMFLVTSITATDVITPSLTPIETPETEVQAIISHCYVEVTGVKGFWVERWYSNSLMDAYFVPKSSEESRISGINIYTTNSNGISHRHDGSLSTCKDISPNGNRTRVNDLSGLNNADWENAVQVIDNPVPDISIAAYPYEYYYVTDDTTATYYGDLVCSNN